MQVPLDKQGKTTASQVLDSDHFVNPSRTPLTSPASRTPDFWFTHHQLLTQEAEESEKQKAVLAGLFNCRLVVNEGKTFQVLIKIGDVKIRKVHLKMETLPPS